MHSAASDPWRREAFASTLAPRTARRRPDAPTAATSSSSSTWAAGQGVERPREVTTETLREYLAYMTAKGRRAHIDHPPASVTALRTSRGSCERGLLDESPAARLSAPQAWESPAEDRRARAARPPA